MKKLIIERKKIKDKILTYNIHTFCSLFLNCKREFYKTEKKEYLRSEKFSLKNEKGI
jgi:hypothetical protein